MNNIRLEYYIEEDFSVLAGPFYDGNKNDDKYKNNVINDMKRGGIEWRITRDPNYNRTYIERKGMILPKRK